MNNNVLLILASGKSSRFGGYPKAFCKIGKDYVVQRTVDIARRYFEKIYLVINREIYDEYEDIIIGCKTISIGTGQGDAHSFLRAAKIIKNDCGANRITLCWGDTIYTKDSVFKQAVELDEGVFEKFAGISFSSIDTYPYAWYEIDGDMIKSSHFKSKDGTIKKGIHDQSIFTFRLDVICRQLNAYMQELGINDDEDFVNKEVSKEMKLLDSFTYFYENKGAGMLPMKYLLVETGGSYSFNTSEELEGIKRNIFE